METTGKEKLTEDMCAYIETHYREKYSMKKLAESLFLNESYLLRVFKEVTGETPLKYHNRVRCEHAAEMLAKGERPIAYIATEVGFLTSSHFAKVFRRCMGISPTEYRSQNSKSQF